MLLDYRLKELGIEPSTITGYEREEFTHLMVAAAVASGTADVGLGILAAARALSLDFVPLLQERYDLIIPTEHYESALAPAAAGAHSRRIIPVARRGPGRVRRVAHGQSVGRVKS